MTARKSFHYFHSAEALVKAFLIARMAIGTEASAVFLAFENFMVPVLRVTQFRTNVPAKHFRLTFLQTPAFRREIHYLAHLKTKINYLINQSRSNYVMKMYQFNNSVTFQFKMSANLLVGVENLTDCVPQFALSLKVLHISNHKESLFSPG